MALYFGENPIELYTSGTENGLTAFVHIKYATLDDYSDMSTTADGAKYMGIYVDHMFDSSGDPTKYNWTQISYSKDYLHIAYADDSSGTNFSTTYIAGASYIGFLIDNNEAASTTVSDYSWIAINPTNSDFATKEYVNTTGGKINVIKINNSALEISADKEVNIDLSSYAPINSPAFTGAPTAPNIDNNGSSRIATVDYVDTSGGKIDLIKLTDAESTQTLEISDIDKSVTIDVSGYAPLENPILTGLAMADDFDDQGNNLVDNNNVETGSRSRIATKKYVDDFGGRIDSITLNNNDPTLVTVTNKNANINLTAYPTAENLATPQSIVPGETVNADTLGDVIATDYATKAYVQSTFAYNNDVRLNNAREPWDHYHDISDITNLEATLGGKANSVHTHNSLSNGVQTISLPQNILSNDTFVLTSDLNNKITYGTQALTAGVSELTSGVLYFQYEE